MKKDLKLNPLAYRLITAGIVAVSATAAVAAARHHNAKKHGEKNVKATKAAKLDPSIKHVVGTWYVNQHGKESHAQRLVLRPNNTFAFVGAGWASEGNYSVKEGNINLEWTSVDGQKVKKGQMKKTLALNTDMNSFVIDQYTYDKHEEGAG